MTDFFIRRGEFGHKHTQEECHVITGAEIGVMYLQAKKHEALSATIRQRGKVRKDPLLEPQREHGLTNTLI